MKVLFRCVLAAAIGLTGSAFAQPAVTRAERGQLVLENVPETPQSLKEQILQYQNTRGAGFLSFSPDGKSILIATRFGETAQLHRVDQPMGMRRQLTFYEEPVSGFYRLGPGSRTVLFSKDHGGDENFQLYLMDEASGGATRFTEADSRNTGATFSDDGAWLAWASVAKGSSKYRIMLANGRAPKEPRVIFEEEGAWSPTGFSPDGKKLIIGKAVSVNESYVWVLDTATGAKTQINPSDKTIAYSAAEFSADGQSVFVISDEDSEFARLVRIDLKDNRKTILSGDLKWDVDGITVSQDRKTIAYIVNEAGISKAHIIRPETGEKLPSPALPLGVFTGGGFSPDGGRLAISMSASDTTNDVWLWDLKTRALTRWTQSETGGIDPSSFVEPKLIAYTTFDQVDGRPRQITAFLYQPPGPGPHPVMISIHGGPESQFQPSFTGNFQFLVRRLGIAVIAPNVRGSTGYGKTFVNLDNGRLREDSVKDIGALLDWIATQPGLDKNRVAVSGGSYGGYMSYAVMTNYSDRLAAGISVVGISNFVTFLKNTSNYRRDLRRVEYGDESNPEMAKFLESISPLTNAAKIKKPMFIIQGLNDPRVPASEAAQMLKAIRANGQDAWYMLAKDEGHGFAKKVNRDAQSEATALFLLSKLLGRSAP